MVVLVAYSAWVYPFEVAFLNASPEAKLWIADNIVDVFFAIDIALTFSVAYIDPRTQLLVRNSRKIALRLVRPYNLFFCCYSSVVVVRSTCQVKNLKPCLGKCFIF
jgi:hypothetical protein